MVLLSTKGTVDGSMPHPFINNFMRSKKSCNLNPNRYNTSFFSNVPYVVAASIFAYIGLVNNDTAVVIASMLFSPIGSQIIRSGIGFLSGNPTQIQLGVTNHMLYVVIIWLIGFILGKFLKNYEPKENEEIMKRVKWVDSRDKILTSIVLAVLSGVILGMASADDASLAVGIGIGASLLPPLVNSGLLYSLGYNKEGMYSMLLWLVNYVCVLISMVITMKIHCSNISSLNKF